ncbi:hypothetical protein [Burkholderia contaminans]|uniref:Uncharacterized protein n=1 Tax=Burkholderia contaminans TaxID=488447 RepID=A0A3N8QQP8_9BURK|nr:hypothetical protein [Burkholderia contaminans]RQT26068.1 hypothetical protein DF037_20480 [Burkholderia contaminans]
MSLLKLKIFFHHLFTEVDNATPDLAKYMAAITSLDFVFTQTWDTVVNKVPFNATAFGTGGAALFAGIGVWMAVKKDSPMKNDDESKEAG